MGMNCIPPYSHKIDLIFQLIFATFSKNLCEYILSKSSSGLK